MFCNDTNTSTAAPGNGRIADAHESPVLRGKSAPPHRVLDVEARLEIIASTTALSRVRIGGRWRALEGMGWNGRHGSAQPGDIPVDRRV